LVYDCKLHRMEFQYLYSLYLLLDFGQHISCDLRPEQYYNDHL
jgi:hypothetical protein